MLRSHLCNYSDVYIIVKERISVRGTNDANRINKKLTFKNNSPFRSCILKINNIFVGNAEDLDIVMLIYNLLKYSNSYSTASGILGNCCRDEVNDSANEIDDNYNKINNNKATTGKSFEYKTKIKGSIPNNNNILDAEVVVPLR